MKNNSKYLFLQSRSGFSLVELMVAIAIIGILAGIAIPNFLSFLPNSRLRAATRDVVSCLQEMKIRAIKENANTVIDFDLANDQYTAFVDNGAGAFAGDGIQNGTEAIIKQVTMLPDIDMNNSTFAGNTFGYNSRGLSTSGGTLSITNNINTTNIIANIAGNIRVQ